MIQQSLNRQLAEELGALLLERNIRCAVAESCTGGTLAGVITQIPGSSQWFERGFVTYSNEAKEDMLKVSHKTINKHGAVSEETASEMAEGAIAHSNAEVSIAITGIAGPSGGSPQKPVGTVCISWAGDYQPTYTQSYFFTGDRISVREQAIQVALQGLIARCDPRTPPQTQEESDERYFFALYPNKNVSQALHDCSQTLVNDNAIHKEKLHVTLLYLGSVHTEFLKAAMNIAGHITVKKFNLEINQDNYWSHNKIRYLGTDKTPKELERLFKKLNQGLVSIGFKPQRTDFIPHVTIKRKSQKTKPQGIVPISWPVTDFCLMKSIPGKKTTRYEIVHRWHLK